MNLNDIPKTRYRILDLLPPGPVVGVEVGTDTGINARELLLARPDLFLWTVDPWVADKAFTEQGRGTAIHFYDVRVGQFVRAGRTKHLRMTSVEGAKEIKRMGIAVDFVYIDASHEEPDVWDDLNAWFPVLRDGGLLAGHDFDLPGVSSPVIRFAKRLRLDLEILNEHGGPDFDVPGSGRDGWSAPCHPTWLTWKRVNEGVVAGNKE